MRQTRATASLAYILTPPASVLAFATQGASVQRCVQQLPRTTARLSFAIRCLMPLRCYSSKPTMRGMHLASDCLHHPTERRDLEHNTWISQFLVGPNGKTVKRYVSTSTASKIVADRQLMVRHSTQRGRCTQHHASQRIMHAQNARQRQCPQAAVRGFHAAAFSHCRSVHFICRLGRSTGLRG